VPGIGYRFERRGLNERLSRSLDMPSDDNDETEDIEPQPLPLGDAAHAAAG